MPAHKKLLNLLKNTGPLYSSSANISGKETIKKTIEASNEFREDLKDIFIIRGKERDYYPSTIVDFDKLVVLRRGRVDGQEVLDALKGVK
jgi:L-threonylcarbamoyladenylate synthase